MYYAKATIWINFWFCCCCHFRTWFIHSGRVLMIVAKLAELTHKPWQKHLKPSLFICCVDFLFDTKISKSFEFFSLYCPCFLLSSWSYRSHTFCTKIAPLWKMVPLKTFQTSSMALTWSLIVTNGRHDIQTKLVLFLWY